MDCSHDCYDSLEQFLSCREYNRFSFSGISCGHAGEFRIAGEGAVCGVAGEGALGDLFREYF